VIRNLWALAPVLLLSACAEPLGPGKIGTPRYFAQLLGEPPMRVLPPRTDRAGNIYVLYGDTQWTETAVYVGHAQGGWSGGCSAHRGVDYGLHGFSGHTTNRAWYWSGDALVEVDGRTGACREVLSSDPVTSTSVEFRAVMPFVRQTSARSTLLALVQGTTDPAPIHTVVDLDQRLYGDFRPFEPTDATDIRVIGVGANHAQQRGYLVVQYTWSGSSQFQALVLDHAGDELYRVSLDASEVLDEFAVVGELGVSETGLAAGVLDDGRVLVFDNNGGSVIDIDVFEAVGVQVRGGQLWLTGLDGNQPLIAAIKDSKEIGNPQTWASADTLRQRIARGVVVLDERRDPSAKVPWKDAASAMADHPLVTPHPLDPYTLETTGWMLAGPYYESIDTYTSVAFVPVGVSFP
jgi:hypothetical protein